LGSISKKFRIFLESGKLGIFLVGFGTDK